VPNGDIRVSVGSMGYIGEDASAARSFWFQHWHTAMDEIGKIRGFRAPGWQHFEAQATGKGALFVGAPEEIAERIVNFQRKMGHMRQFFQMDLGHLPQKDLLHSIELLGTKVKPLVDAELGHAPALKETEDA
jgi:alkanesulfonate monooxygenase SsuD/methylene tetrahydromethanopterin reductase-like flavin-dependent oxidoreductase (luciferase family)